MEARRIAITLSEQSKYQRRERRKINKTAKENKHTSGMRGDFEVDLEMTSDSSHIHDIDAADELEEIDE